jgi:hypothetical protein
VDAMESSLKDTPFAPSVPGEPPKDNRRFFIIGSQKSGTTWLRDCLDEFVLFCKPEWYYPQLLSGLADHIDSFGVSIPAEKRLEAVRSISDAVWKALNGDFAGEKSAYPCSTTLGAIRPDIHALAVSKTREYFPNSRIGVIVRDPRAVFNSLRHYLDHFREGWSRETDPKIFAETWAHQNLEWVRQKPDAIVFYERLKTDFETTPRRAFSNLGIEHTPDDIARTKTKAYAVDGLRSRQPEIYRTGTIDEWRCKLEPEVAETILAIAGPAMTEIGYDLSREGA